MHVGASMKKLLYLMGSIEAIIGILLLCVVAFIYDLDKYYSISIPLASVLAIVLIFTGIVQIVFAFIKNP